MCPPTAATQIESAPQIHHLPLEILSYIFELAVHADLDAQGFTVPTQSTSPLLLTWVCSSWRQLALCSSSLWSSVCIGSRGFVSAKELLLLDLFISRAGESLPLSFSLTCDRHESARPMKPSGRESQRMSYLQSIDAIATRLVRVRHRWQRLIAHVLVLDALEPFMKAISQGTPKLEYLSLSTMYTGFHGRQHWLDLKSCSQLRTVRILTPMIFFDPATPLLDHITILQLHFCHSQIDAYSWLSCCPNLEKLSIELYGSLLTDQIDPVTAEKIRLPRLSHFSLMCFFGESNPGPLFDVLVLPSLRNFSFSRCGLALLRPDSSWSSVVNLFDRSGNPAVEELRLVRSPTAGSELSILLQRIGSEVKRLTLGGDATTDDILQQFYSRLDAKFDENRLGAIVNLPPLCPKLESLELINTDVSFSAVICFAEARAGTPGEQGAATSASASINTLKRLALSNEEFSHYLQHAEYISQFPRNLKVVLV